MTKSSHQRKWHVVTNQNKDLSINLFSGENATLSCKIGSVPISKVRWFRDGTEVLNNSMVNRGMQQFIIYENGTFERTSWLILTNVRAEDSGPFMCVSQNQAGRVEANFTLQVSCFVFVWLFWPRSLAASIENQYIKETLVNRRRKVSEKYHCTVWKSQTCVAKISFHNSESTTPTAKRKHCATYA